MVLQKPDVSVLEAIARLGKSNTDFEVYLAWLEESLEQADRHSVGLDGNECYRDQGARNTVRQQVDMVASAQDHLAAIAANDADNESTVF